MGRKSVKAEELREDKASLINMKYKFADAAQDVRRWETCL